MKINLPHRMKQLFRRPFLRMERIAPVILFMALLIPVAGGLAYAKGGDVIAPFPVIDGRAGKQEANAFAVDSAGNIVIAGYTNTGVNGNDWQVVKVKADGSGLAWAATFGGTGDDVATAVAVDSAGNIVVAGYTWNGSNYDVHTIKYNGADGAELWHHTYASAGGINDFSSAIAVDASNNVYVAGHAVNGAQKDDILLLKYAAGGPVAEAPEWVELYDDAAYPNSDNRATAIAAGTGGIAVTGYSSKAGTDFDMFSRKYASDKSLIREWRYSSAGSRDDRGTAVKMDSAGNVIVTGYFTNASNNTGIYTVKYNPGSDTPVWEKTYDDGIGNDKPTALWVDGSGDVYVAGYTATLAGNEDFCTFRYGSADGNGGWQVFYDAGNGSTDIPLGIVVDDGVDGDVFVAGYTTAAGTDNFQTMKYRKATGNLLWQRAWNGSGNKGDRPVGIGLDAARNVCVAGWSDGAADYDFVALKYDFGALNAPTVLTATAASDTSITLTWVDNSSNEETFVIQRKLGEGGIFADITTAPAVLPADTVTYTDTGLTANNYYYYRVRAYNAANGDSQHTNEARALTKVITYDAPGWSYTYDGVTGEDVATGIAVGSDDHPVTTGYSLVADVGGNSFDYVTVKLNRGDKSLIWQSSYDSGDGGTDLAAGVAVDTKDDKNDVIVTGTAYVFGGGDENSDDLYTLKYLSANGNPSTEPGWPKRYGTGNWADNAVSVVTATDGSSAVIGYGMNGATGVGNNDIYIIKYNPDGTQAWTPYVYNSGRDDYPTAVAFDQSGNIFVTGYTRNASGNDDWFTAKIKGSDGTLVWSDQMDGGGHGHDKGMSVAIDAGGDAYVTGYALNEAGNEDVVTIKYKGTPALPPAADLLWTKSYDGPANGHDRGIAVAVDPIDGAVVVAGTRYTTATDSDLYIVRYNSADRSVIWERNFDRPATYDYATAMAMDSSGYIYVTGNSRGGVDTNPDFNASSDVLSVIYDFEGTFLGALSYNGSAGKQDEAKAIAVNYQGESFIAGLSRNAAGVADYLALKHKNNYILVPAPLAATAQADYGKVDLTWRQNTPGTSFRIERTLGPSNPGSVWTAIATPGSGTLTYTDTGLAAGTSYCYRIDAYIGSLNSRKIEKCVTTTLPAPVLSPLTVDSVSQISMGWSQVTGNTGYKIERKTGAGGTWGAVTTQGPDQNSYTDTGLAAGTTYYYRISTNSAAGYSSPSNEVFAITKPAAPTINAPTGITKNQMTLGWNSITGASSYSLEFKESGGVYAPFASCTAIAGTSCIVTGLTTDKTYFFHVKAANVSGSSDWSNETSGRALLPEPTLSSASGVSKTQIDLAWTAVAEATGYAIQRSTCSYNNSNPGYCSGADGYYGTWGQIGTTLAGTTTYSVTTGLSTGGNYRFRIIATVTGNTSAPSNVIAAWTWLTPTVDANFNILPKTSTSLTVSWSDVTGETAYSIERRPPAGMWAVIKANQALNTTSYDDTGLALSTEYCYRMRPLNAGVVGQPEAETYTAEKCKFTPLNAPVLNAPTGITTISVTLTWNNVVGNNGYEVQRSVHNDPQNPGTNNWGAYTIITSPKLGTDVTTYDNTALTPGYTYRYQVRDTFGAADFSSWSNAVQMTAIPPAPVLNNPTGSGTSSVSLTWNNTFGETSFKIERKADAGGTWAEIGTSAQNTPSYADSGLAAGIVYYYRVRGANAFGNSDYSNEKSVLPGPTLNALSGITASKIDLSWNNITGNSGYRIERKTGAAGSWSQIATVGTDVTTYPNTGLAAGTLYYYRVSASNANGGSLLSNEQSATTTPATTTVTATVVSSAEVSLSWQVMYGATEYHVEQKIGAGGTWSPIGTTVKAYSQSYCGYAVPRIGCTSLTADTASFSATGLTENITYCYQVMAWNTTGGNSVPSGEKCVTTSAMANQSLFATAVNSFKIQLDWSPIACTPNPCDDPDGYEVEKQAWNNEWVLVKTVPPDTTTFTDTIGIEPLKARKYRVRTFKGADFSPYSNVVTVIPPAYETGSGTCR